jgi:hypothetical protein
MLGSCTFWLLSLILIVACLVPDCAFNVLQRYTPAAYAKLQKVCDTFQYNNNAYFFTQDQQYFGVRNSLELKLVDFMVLGIFRS